MQQQISDFQTEVRELSRVLGPLDARDWERETQFKGYTINDIVRHLHQGDLMGLASLAGPEAFQEMLDERAKRRKGGVTMRDDARLQFGHIGGAALLDLWQSQAEALADGLAALEPDARLTWTGPSMGVKMFATARQMEVWAHGHDVHDVLGLDRAPTKRLRNIAEIGVRTYGWTFKNRGMEAPGAPPHVRLDAPGNEVWEWHDGSTTGKVSGSALEFCQVVTQVRNVTDCALNVDGDSARLWMSLAQCFAGPPEDPPVAGRRFKV
ncbi:MAG: TIGR03084 family metal-binding protein [Hyphomicrobiaceae bacterium]